MRTRSSGDERRANIHAAALTGRLPPLDPTVGELTPDELEREKARRVLIYRDMLARCGKVQYRQLATWDYQPSAAEVDVIIAEARAVNAANRDRERERLGGVRSHRAAS